MLIPFELLYTLLNLALYNFIELILIWGFLDWSCTRVLILSTYILLVQVDRFIHFLLFSWWFHGTCGIKEYCWCNVCPWNYTHMVTECLAVLIWLHLSLHWKLWLSVSCVLRLTGFYEMVRLGSESLLLGPW